ncbi:uncharacterized protein LOC128251893 isoform X2 [Drosophila gunungcola]|nr:uncharacterized protein LOC128251893 isoform X2 [Drosophila gunungcola]
MDRDDRFLPHQIAAAKAQSATRKKTVPPIPPPRPLRRAGAATAATAGTGAGAAPPAAAYLAAQVPCGGKVSHSGSSTPPLPSSAIKSSLANRRVAGGKIPDQVKRRVKFSANVHTFTTVTNAKKSTRIGELQLKKKVKKLKRNRPRREGGSGGVTGVSESGSINQNIDKHGTIVDVESLKAPSPPRVLRLNVVGKSSPATGKSALAEALRRKAQRSLLSNSAVTQEKTRELKATGSSGSKKVKRKATSGSTKTLLGSSSNLVENSAELAGRKKSGAAKTTGIQRCSITKPLNGRRVNGKVV